MPRVKKAKNALKKRRTVLKMAKGYRHGRSKKERQAREGILHAGVHAFAGRRDKKNDFRTLWNIKINAAVRPLGLTYSKFINLLKKNKIELDRKVLAQMAGSRPESFERLVQSLKT